MKKTKLALLCLSTALVVSTTGALTSSIYATADTVAYSASNIFTTSSGASITSSENDYTAFVFGDKSKVTYRRDLALEWQELSSNSTRATELLGDTKTFSMTFSFDTIKFTEFNVALQTNPNNYGDEDHSENIVKFTYSNNTLYAKVNDETSKAISGVATQDLTLSLSEIDDGVASFYINGTKFGDFTNIGEKFADYKASSTSPLIPLTLSTEIEGEDVKQTIQFKSMNGQSFALDSNKQIIDNAKPVLVVNEDIKTFTLGKAIDFSYTAIDVLDKSPSKTMTYYVYDGTSDAEREYKTYTSSTTLFNTKIYAGYNAEYISIKFNLKDTASNSNDSYIEWYAPDTATKITAKSYTYNDKEVNTVASDYKYIPVTKNTANGAEYTCVTTDDNLKTSVLNKNNVDLLNYQTAVEQASKKEDGTSIQIGSGAYFYLPSMSALFDDDDTAYSSLTFSIYYRSTTKESSSTSLKYNRLKIELPDDGKYVFRVVATDKNSNSMFVYDETGKKVAISSSNVWNLDCIPEFTFNVKNTGPVIDESKEQKSGFSGVSYSITDFTIKSMNGYKSDYALYRFDIEKYNSENANNNLTYDELIANANDESYEKYWIEITEWKNVEEDDKDYISDYKYLWKPSSLTFTPVDDGYYMVKINLVDPMGLTANSFKVINIIDEVDTVTGEIYWVQDNIPSIVFGSISIALAIAIVIVFFSKPKETIYDETFVGEAAKVAENKDKQEKKTRKIRKLKSDDDQE